jgi:hypothetical protein
MFLLVGTYGFDINNIILFLTTYWLLTIEISKCYLCNAGFNSTLRRGCISYHEYLQIGKGRDVSLNSISKFEAKVANGNSEQTISRDIFRLARQFDFFRMLSCYFTTIGFYFSSLVISSNYHIAFSITIHLI